MTNSDDIRARIDNAIAILTASGAAEAHAVPRNLELAVETLRAAQTALDERDAELELVTNPDLNAAEEVQRLKARLEKAKNSALELEQELAMEKHELGIERELHSADEKRLKDLEKKSKDLDKILMDDDDAFARYMDQAMDEQERNGRGPTAR